MTKSLKRFAQVSLMGLMAFGAVGCASSADPLPPVYQRHKIPVVENVERLEIYTPAAEAGLTMEDMQGLIMFLDEYAANGQGGLYINRPMAAGNMRGADEALSIVHNLMRERRIDASMVSEGSYNAGGVPSAPVVLSYRRLTAQSVDCGYMSDVTQNGNNQALPEFGCVQRSNLAAMISDPTQLITPTAQTPRYNTRVVGVLDAYGQGEATAAQISPEQQVGVSQVQ